MMRHSILMLLRVMLAAVVVYILPFAHMKWGEPYLGDGQEAFGIIMLFTMIGAGLAVVYFVLGSTVQFFLRRKPWRWTAFSDALAFFLLAGLLTYGGVAAHYSGNGETSAAQDGVEGVEGERLP